MGGGGTASERVCSVWGRARSTTRQVRAGASRPHAVPRPLSRMDLAGAVACGGLRPSSPAQAPTAWQELVQACWQADPAARPSAADAAARLGRLVAELPEDAALQGVARGTAVAQAQALSMENRGDRRADAVVAPGGVTPGALPEPDGVDGGDTDVHQVPLAAVPRRPLPPIDPAIGVGSSPGPRGVDKMEDYHIVAGVPDPFTDTAPRRPAKLLGVFDGHRGAAAAEFLAARSVAELGAPPRQRGAAWLAAGISRLDDAFRARPRRRGDGGAQHSGSTVLLALLQPGRCSLAWAGDSQAVLGSRHGPARPLTRRHSPQDEAERARLLAAGARVWRHRGDWRIGAPGLTVSRWGGCVCWCVGVG